MDEPAIIYDEQDSVAIITLNRPKQYNALNREAKKEIRSVLSRANKSQGVSSIILTGKGKAFCSGQDLGCRSAKKKEGGQIDLGQILEQEWNPLVRAIRGSGKIVFAAVNGVVAGAGLSVAMACDLIVCAPGVKFVSGFSKLALVPDAGSSATFVRALGYRKALEFFLLGEPLISEDLLNVGMINSIDNDPLKGAKEKARMIGKLSLKATELAKKNFQMALEISYEESLERETMIQRYLGHKGEYREGVEAFFEKREPVFNT